MVRRERMEGGTRELPRTRTSSVPGGLATGECREGVSRDGNRRWFTIAALVEAVGRIAVVGEDDDFVAAGLEADCCVDDEAFRAADAEVRMEEDDCAAGEGGRRA